MWQPDDDDASVADSHAVVAGRIAELLSQYEVGLLARHAFDGQTQTEIAAADGVGQTTISFRVRKAVARLAAAGIAVPVPGRSPASRGVGRLIFVEPAAIDRLVREDPAAGDQSGGPVRGRWPDAAKADQPDAGQQKRRRRRP